MKILEKEIDQQNLWILLILYGIILAIIISIFKSTGFQDQWWLCLDYIKDNVLYGGQPRCIQGPVFLSSLYLLRGLFGKYFFIANNVVIVLLSVLSLAIITSLITRKRITIIISSLLYLFLIFLPIMAENNTDTLYALTFSLIGFYFLYKSKLPFRGLISGIFFSFAFFSKSNSLIIFLIIVLIFFSEIILKKYLKIKIISEETNVPLKQLLLSILSFIIISAIITLIFPNVLNYIFIAPYFVHIGSLTLFITNLISFFQGFTVKNLFVIPAILISGYYLFKKRNVIGYIAFFGTLFIFISMISKESQYYYRYFLPIIPFFVIVIVALTYLILNLKSKVFNLVLKSLWVILLILICLSAVRSVNQYNISLEYNELKKEVEFGLNFIPYSNKIILADKNRFSNVESINEAKRLYIFPNETQARSIYVDASQWDGLYRTGVLTHPELLWNYTDSDNYLNSPIGQSYLDNLSNTEYDIIIAGSNTPRSYLISILDSVYKEYLNNPFEYSFPYFNCVVPIPTLEDILDIDCIDLEKNKNVIFVFFKEIAPCKELINKLENYYSSSFDDICEKDQKVANCLVKGGLKYYVPAPQSAFTGIVLNNTCHSEASLMDELKNRDLFHNKKEPFFIIILFLFLLVYYLITQRKAKS